jgi:hypothetical protein
VTDHGAPPTATRHSPHPWDWLSHRSGRPTCRCRVMPGWHSARP